VIPLPQSIFCGFAVSPARDLRSPPSKQLYAECGYSVAQYDSASINIHKSRLPLLYTAEAHGLHMQSLEARKRCQTAYVRVAVNISMTLFSFNFVHVLLKIITELESAQKAQPPPDVRTAARPQRVT